MQESAAQGPQAKDYIWNTLGVFVQNAISPILLVIVTRLNGISDSGLFSFAFSVAIVFWALGMWGGRTYQVSDTSAEFSSRSYIMVRLVLALCMMIGGCVFSALNQYDISKTVTILSLVLFKAIESVADAYYGVLQVHNHLYVAGKSLFYKFILGLVMFVTVDSIWGSVVLSCCAIVIANLSVLLLYDIPRARKYEEVDLPLGQWAHFLSDAITIVRRCAPIAAVIFLTVFSLNIPRYFIDAYHTAEVGYFGIIAMPITLLSLVITFILQPKVLELSKLFEGRKLYDFDVTVGQIIKVAFYAGLIVLLGAYILGIHALELIFNLSFHEYKLELVIIVVGGIMNGIVAIFINVLIIMRLFKSQFYVLLFSNITLIVLSAVYIKHYGVIAGVTLFTLVNIIQALSLFVMYRRTLKRLNEYNVTNSLIE